MLGRLPRARGMTLQMAPPCVAMPFRGSLLARSPLLLLAAAAALRGAAAQDDSDSSSMLGYDPPLCGVSKRVLAEDPIRRYCLRQCRLEPNKRIRPSFDEFEEYCRESAGMQDWDPDCKRYLGCTYGCAIWGGSRDAMLLLDAADRPTFLLETHADMYAAGITKERRCILEKCHAFCARTSFDTCRETQFVQRCKDSNPHLYGCDVDCNGTPRARPAAAMVAAVALLFSLMGLTAGAA